jgi:hypothetical protein
MLKKMFFVGALLLAANAAYATTPGSGWDPGVSVEQWDNNANIKGESWSWPAQYKFQPVCLIPVKMDIGFWVRVINCKDAVIKMTQNEIRKYSGSTKLTIKTNVSIDLAVDFVPLDDQKIKDALGDYGASVDPDHVDPPEAQITVSAWVNDFHIDKSGALSVGSLIQVGNVTLKVRPSVAPQLKGAA